MGIGVTLWKLMSCIHMFLINRVIMANPLTKLILIRRIGHFINGGIVGRGGKISEHLLEDSEGPRLCPHGRRTGWIALSEAAITVSGINGGMAQVGGSGKT